MYDQVVKCQRAGLCLSEHFLINFAEIQRKINTKRALVTRRTFSYRKTARLSPEKLSELHPKADTIPISAHAQ